MADDGSDVKEGVPAARPYPRSKLGIAVLTLALSLGGLWMSANSGIVTTIRITRHALVPNLTNPDYYARLTLKDGSTLETATLDDVLIGNGLNLDIPSPVKLADVEQIELMDDDPLQDDVLDRADVSGRTCRGQAYAFEFTGPESRLNRVGTVVAWISVFGLVILVLQFIRSQVL